MRAHVTHPRFISRSLLIAAIFVAPLIGLPPTWAAVVDPLANGPVEPDLFTDGSAANLISRTAPVPHQRPRQVVRPTNRGADFPVCQNINYQPDTVQQPPAAAGDDTQTLPAPAGAAAAPEDPCAAVPNTPLNQLGIGIAEPAGKLPTDLAGPCWDQINQTSTFARCWSVAAYNWEATCFYHRPLYFEEVNLERYGYQCGDRCCCWNCGYEYCLQPAASAAHFFGTIPALPYCMAVDCPGDHIYTLGHYRPGSCNPRRRHWPPFDPIAAAAEGGIWTALIFAIP
jgi:hypothetical protein